MCFPTVQSMGAERARASHEPSSGAGRSAPWTVPGVERSLGAAAASTTRNRSTRTIFSLFNICAFYQDIRILNGRCYVISICFMSLCGYYVVIFIVFRCSSPIYIVVAEMRTVRTQCLFYETKKPLMFLLIWYSKTKTDILIVKLLLIPHKNTGNSFCSGFHDWKPVKMDTSKLLY